MKKLILFNLFETYLCLMCSNTMKQGPYRLNLEQEALPEISRYKVKAIRTKLSQDVTNLAIGYRSYWKSYCYNGGALDRNTGCVKELVPVPPTLHELQEWKLKRMCSVCNDAYDQWGSDSIVCLKPITPCAKWVSMKELEKRVTNNHFAYHTCEISWRCGIEVSQIPLYLRIVNNKPTAMMALSNGTLIKLASYLGLQKDIATYVEDSIEILAESLELQCLHEKDKIWCYDEEVKLVIETTFKNKNQICINNFCYALKTNTLPTNYNEIFLKAASIDDIRHHIATETMALEETKFSMLKMAKRIITMERLIMQMINSLAKIDDRLLEKIMGGSFSTEYGDEEHFFINPCINAPKVLSNCYGNKIFRSGRWILNKNLAECTTFNNSKNLTLFSPMDLWMPLLEEQQFRGIPSDYEGWSFIANEKDNLVATMAFTKNGGSGTSLEDVVSLPSGFVSSHLASLFGFSMFNLAVVAGLVVLYILLRKRF